jgi:ribosome biogenesis GTPase
LFASQLTSLELPVIVATADAGAGIDDMRAAIGAGQTAILLGSSGVGKSTLTNGLLERNVQATQAVRQSDDTGRHTTVHRELFILPNGGLLIDTPGIRELQLWGTEDELDDNFDDVTQIASQCGFADCSHTREPGCAIREAIAGGRLDRGHYASYLKMKDELVVLKRKNIVRNQRQNQRSRRSLNRQDRDRLRDEE